MRLHRLEVSAFGPFAHTVTLDLDDLAEAGVFLVHGPTGAGKTSLLDAVCFALYAEVPGPRPAGRGLRSDHASAEAIPRVMLEFTVSGRRCRITRTPEHTRPKRRGTGVTPVQASVHLEELIDGRWRTVSARADEVGGVVRDLLGMGMAQFARVVLLPQGECAAFLRASSDERQELLAKLFDIQRFHDVETWLVEQRRVAAEQVRATQTEFAATVDRVQDVLARLPARGEESAARVADLLIASDVELGEQLSTIAATVRDQAIVSLAERDAAERAAVAAEADLTARTAQFGHRARGEQARSTIADLAHREAELAEAAALLAASARAAGVAGDLRALDAAQDDVAASEQARQRALLSLPPALADQVREPASVAARLAGIAAQDEAVGEAARLKASLETLEQSIRVTRTEIQAHDDEATRCAARAANEDRTIQEAQAALAEIAARPAQLAELMTAEAELSRLLRLRTEHDEARAAAVRAAERHQAALTTALAARDTYQHLQQRRLDGMAGHLAAGLNNGQPCPVCGSARHPAPAPTSDLVDPAQVEGAKTIWEAAQAAADALHTQVVAVQQQAQLRAGDLSHEPRTSQELAQQRAEITGQITSLRALTGQVESLRAVILTAETALATVHERQRLAVTGRDRGAAKLELLHANAQEQQRHLTHLLEQHGRCPCSGTIDEHPVRRVAIDQVHALTQGMQVRELTRDAARERAENSCLAVGFASLDEARQALLSEADAASLRVHLDEAARARAAAEAVLADPEVIQALEHDAPDLHSARRAASQARDVLSAAASRHAFAERAAQELGPLQSRIVELSAQLDALRNRSDLVHRVADAANGQGADNTLKMRLSAYVLAGRLERVAELANERLQRMADGRYRLAHQDERFDRRRRGGLGLAIIDEWTGARRETSTLSGGESFIVSLALALGLADAVREESGGLDLQTLFIDEGFGSLDDDSLEQVMTVLDSLRDGARAVGVVSHVADLRSRIPTQLEVTKTPSGSTAQVRRVG